MICMDACEVVTSCMAGYVIEEAYHRELRVHSSQQSSNTFFPMNSMMSVPSGFSHNRVGRSGYMMGSLG